MSPSKMTSGKEGSESGFSIMISVLLVPAPPLLAFDVSSLSPHHDVFPFFL